MEKESKVFLFFSKNIRKWAIFTIISGIILIFTSILAFHAMKSITDFALMWRATEWTTPDIMATIVNECLVPIISPLSSDEVEKLKKVWENIRQIWENIEQKRSERRKVGIGIRRQFRAGAVGSMLSFLGIIFGVFMIQKGRELKRGPSQVGKREIYFVPLIALISFIFAISILVWLIDNYLIEILRIPV